MGDFIIHLVNIGWALVPCVHLVSPEIQGQETPFLPLRERRVSRELQQGPEPSETCSEDVTGAPRGVSTVGVSQKAPKEVTLELHPSHGMWVAQCSPELRAPEVWQLREIREEPLWGLRSQDCDLGGKWEAMERLNTGWQQSGGLSGEGRSGACGARAWWPGDQGEDSAEVQVRRAVAEPGSGEEAQGQPSCGTAQGQKQ